MAFRGKEPASQKQSINKRIAVLAQRVESQLKAFDFAGRLRKIFKYSRKRKVRGNGNIQAGLKWEHWIIRRAFDKFISNRHCA